MTAIRDAWEDCLARAQDPKVGEDKGLVYLAGWRVNPLRDLSVDNRWRTSPWMDIGSGEPYAQADKRDQTVLGLLLKLITAGVQVRVLVWQPTTTQRGKTPGHAEEHLFLAAAVRRANQLAQQNYGTSHVDYGVVCLDARVAEGWEYSIAAAHHQKMCVVRLAGDADAYAFVGGVDLAYTRRDAPLFLLQPPPAPDAPTGGYNNGDWQSGLSEAASGALPPMGIPCLADGWPLGDSTGGPAWSEISNLKKSGRRFESDLPPAIYGETQQRWHDQHLRIRGPAVATFQQQFCERWSDAGIISVLGDDQGASDAQARESDAQFSSENAVQRSDPAHIDQNVITPLPSVSPVAAISGATSTVQMWRTIPARQRGNATLFAHGEFTVLAGYANAVAAAQNLIFICDQYFWSLPLARSLNAALRMRPQLAVVLVLPPHADGTDAHIGGLQHEARRRALTVLADGLTEYELPRVGVLNLWEPAGNVGVYVHAKAHIYDGTLLTCGSANMNRRSMVGDSEIVAAVLDPAVAVAHLKKMWSLLTGDVILAKWPLGPDNIRPYDPSTDAGYILLAGLLAGRNLIPDPQFADLAASTVPLPNGQQRSTAHGLYRFDQLYNMALENSSLNPTDIEGRAVDLARMSAYVENPALYKKIGRHAIRQQQNTQNTAGTTP